MSQPHAVPPEQAPPHHSPRLYEVDLSRRSKSSNIPPSAPSRSAQDAAPTRRINRLHDAVYREMLLLESQRPGAEMGLALALLRAYVQAESLPRPAETREWLNRICPICLRLIEKALGDPSACRPEST